MKISIWILLALVFCAHAFADEIEVPEEELARESTLPVFSKRRVVLNRNVVTDKRIEVGVGAGLELNEPFYNTYMFNMQGTYNIDEINAVNVQGLYWMQGLSSYGEQLLQGTSGPNGRLPFDASKAPHAQWAMLANYEYIAYYGKISISKQTVLNLNLFGLLGVGYINMGSVGEPALNIGLGQNFFFTKDIGLRWDLRWLTFQGPNPTSVALSPTGPTPSASSFGNRLYFNGQMGLALIYIL